ncbi:ABC transporter substrate-binding protein [Gryllotalpicola protaetiae]|uniref:Extracellular solute-binding protein n=1 Tax=Gryllotalpicola protaetiae TaxID=2419771 RepID=A0A387BM98_9MICO|nr:extracellular solute-binding protein [Gryllotalpicola protaetiae]AYG03798.1 extracellular solute-binding protein [Gryllotalpicola protaetiae]
MAQQSGAAFTRRTFIGVAGGVAASTLLAACSRGGASTAAGGKTLKFWNMPWGPPAFLTEDKKIVAGFSKGGYTARYQQIQWANFTTQFATGASSNTGPAVSSGGGTQAFQYAAQGKIQYADDLIDSWADNGLKDDFLDGLLDAMKTDKGYAAVPYNLDVRVAWYNTAMFDQWGLDVPTTWDEYKTVCAGLKSHGVYGFGIGAGAGNNTGFHTITAFLINNGGGWFNEKQEPDAVTDRNEEALEYVLELVKNGYSDPAAVGYTSANIYTQFQQRKFGYAVSTAGLPQNVGGDVAKELAVAEPLTGPHGDSGGLYFPNNIMMWTNTPSKKASEDFTTYYYQNMQPLWTKKTGIGLPPLTSITKTPEFASDANNVKIVKDWIPIFKTWAAPGGSGLFANVANTVDGTAPSFTFAQTVLTGKTTAKAALQAFQNTLEGLMK